jgi:hypothetical protein
MRKRQMGRKGQREMRSGSGEDSTRYTRRLLLILLKDIAELSFSLHVRRVKAILSLWL